MIYELFRPLVRWLFWNRHRWIIVLAGLFVILAVAVRLAGGGAASQGSRPQAAGPVATAPAAAPAPSSTVPPSPAPPASTSAPPAPADSAPASPSVAAALQVADVFLQAWVSRSADRAAQIRAVATPQLAAEVTGPGAALAPATMIDGPLTVTGQGLSAVSVSAPTDAGPALLTVRYTAGRWLAAQVMLSKTGD